MTYIGLLLTLSFIALLGALGFLIWAIVNRQFTLSLGAAASIFEAGEMGVPDDATAFPDQKETVQQHSFDAARGRIDDPGRNVVLLMVVGAALALIAGSVFGLIASLKLHLPDLLNESAAMTFGRVRTMRLNLAGAGRLPAGGQGGCAIPSVAAAVAMLLSSLSVVANSARLARPLPAPTEREGHPEPKAAARRDGDRLFQPANPSG